MANEIQFRSGATGSTLYAILLNTVGQVWDVVGSAWATIEVANWGNYDIALAESPADSYRYQAAMPAVAAGIYDVLVFQQAGGAPAITDTGIGTERMEWDGTAEVPLTSRASQLTALAVKAKTDTIGAADLTAVSPVLEDGDLEIVQGDDYMDADGRALEWGETNYTGPIQDGDDVEFALMETADYHAAGGTPALTKAGTAHLVGTTLRIVVELTAAETAALEPSPPDDRMNYTYQVRVDVGSSGSGERRVTAALGAATVKKKVVV